jgi:hypothetical protein
MSRRSAGVRRSVYVRYDTATERRGYSSRMKIVDEAGVDPAGFGEAVRGFYFLASGVTVIFTRWPSRMTTISTG